MDCPVDFDPLDAEVQTALRDGLTAADARTGHQDHWGPWGVYFRPGLD